MKNISVVIVAAAFSSLSLAADADQWTRLICVGEKTYTDKTASELMSKLSNDPIEVFVSEKSEYAKIKGYVPRFRMNGGGFLEYVIAEGDPFEIKSTDDAVFHSSSKTKGSGDLRNIASFQFRIDRRSGTLEFNDSILIVRTNGTVEDVDEVVGKYKCQRHAGNVF